MPPGRAVSGIENPDSATESVKELQADIRRPRKLVRDNCRGIERIRVGRPREKFRGWSPGPGSTAVPTSVRSAPSLLQSPPGALSYRARKPPMVPPFTSGKSPRLQDLSVSTGNSRMPLGVGSGIRQSTTVCQGIANIGICLRIGCEVDGIREVHGRCHSPGAVSGSRHATDASWRIMQFAEGPMRIHLVSATRPEGWHTLHQSRFPRPRPQPYRPHRVLHHSDPRSTNRGKPTVPEAQEAFVSCGQGRI